MERKVLFEREEMLINREETLNAVWKILEEYAPVSYTHLDVYKRQYSA